MANVLICVENPAFGHALEEIVELIEPFHAIGVVADARSLLDQLGRTEVRILILDTKVLARTGSDLLRALDREYPNVKVVQVVDWSAAAGLQSLVTSPHCVVSIDASVKEWADALRRACPVAQRPRIPATVGRVSGLLGREAAALALVVTLSAFLARDLFVGDFISTGYADWIFHAYRVRSLEYYGFLTWTNDWGGGFPLWETYQFVPHAITLGLKSLTGWSITKAMCFVTAILFVAFRLIVYSGLRLSRLPLPAALIGSVLTLAMVSYYSALTDFSLLWGVTAFPVVIFSYAGGTSAPRRMYLAALVVGLGVYVHPLLFVIGMIGLASRLVSRGDVPPRVALGALAIAVLAAAFFWFPLLGGDKPAYVNEWELSTVFMRKLFPTSWLGLGPSLIAVAFVALVLGLRGFRSRAINPTLFSTTVLTLGLVVFVVASTYAGYTPGLINQLEPTRWMPFVGILLAILGAFALQEIVSKGKWYTPVLVVVVILYITADSLVIARAEMPRVESQQPVPAVILCLSEYGRVSYADRIVSRTLHVPEISFYDFGKARLAGNYFGKGAMDILYQPLTWLLFNDEAGSTLQTRDPTLALAYMKAVGGTLFLTSDSEPIARALLPGGSLAGALLLRHRSDGFALFEPSSKPPQAIITSLTTARDLAFPDLKYNTEEQKRLRDKLVLRFANVMDAPETIAPEVSYPSQTQIDIVASGVPEGKYLIVLAPYTSSWEARVNGELREVERAGPRYVGVNLSGVEGTIHVVLTHRMHWTWKIGMVLVGLAFVVCSILIFSPGWAARSLQLRYLGGVRQ